MALLCGAFGITDVGVRVYGRRNVKNVVRAFFTGMHNSRISEREFAEAHGRKLFDPRRDYRYRSQRPSSTASNAWTVVNKVDNPYDV